MEAIYDKLIEIARHLKILLSSFHLKGPRYQTQKVEPPRKVLLSAFHLNGRLSLGLAFLWVLFIMCIRWI